MYVESHLVLSLLSNALEGPELPRLPLDDALLTCKLSVQEDEGGGVEGGGEGRADGSAAVINDQLLDGLIVFPAKSFTFDTVAVYELENASDDEGEKVAVGFSVPVKDTVPATDEPALFFTTNVEVDTVEACTGSLNVAVIWEVVITFDASATGV